MLYAFEQLIINTEDFADGEDDDYYDEETSGRPDDLARLTEAERQRQLQEALEQEDDPFMREQLR